MSADDNTRDFAELCAELGDGMFNREATRLLAEIAERVRRHGGDGKLTITISLEPVGDAIDITTSFRSKKPHAPIPATKVWADEEGALRTTDPLQEVLPFRRPKGPRETT